MRWGFIIGEPLTTFESSADPADLEDRIVAALARINALTGTHVISAISLAGAGYGDIFTVRIEFGEIDNGWDFSPSGPATLDLGLPGGLAMPRPTQLVPVVYMADDLPELATERARYYAENYPTFPPVSMLLGSEMAGTTHGRRVCVLELIAPTSLYTEPAPPAPH